MRRGPDLLGVTILAIAIGCRHGGPPAPRPQVVIDGEWQYLAPSPVALAVTLELWQAGDSLGGRVLYWLSGDVVVPAGTFGPISGRRGPEAGRVRLVLVPPAPAPGEELEAQLTGDTLLIRTSAAGSAPGTLAAGGKLVRRR